MIFSKKYDVYRTFTRMLAVRAYIKFRFSLSLSLSATCTYICQSKCIGRDCFLLFSEECIVYIILTMSVFIGSQSFISIPSFMFVGAAVSEICESNRKNLQMAIFNLTLFLGIYM